MRLGFISIYASIEKFIRGHIKGAFREVLIFQIKDFNKFPRENFFPQCFLGNLGFF